MDIAALLLDACSTYNFIEEKLLMMTVLHTSTTSLTNARRASVFTNIESVAG